MDSNSMDKWILICKAHKFQHEVHYLPDKFNSWKWLQGFTMCLPIDLGPDLNLVEPKDDAGLGGDQQLTRVLQMSIEILDNGMMATKVHDKSKSEKNTKRRSLSKSKE